jgi:hypothetical protein
MVVDEHHALHLLLWRLPPLSDESVVELLLGRVDPVLGGGRDRRVVRRGKRSGNGRDLSVRAEGGKLGVRETGLGKSRHLVERVYGVIRMVYRAFGGLLAGCGREGGFRGVGGAHGTFCWGLKLEGWRGSGRNSLVHRTAGWRDELFVEANRDWNAVG